MKPSWPTKKLGDVLILYDNGIWGPEDLATGVSILRSTNFNNDGTISFDNVALRKVKNGNLDKKKLQKGDILLERSGGGPKQPVGRVVYFDSNREYYFGNFITRLRPKDDVYSKFLFNILFDFHQKGLTNKLQKQTTGIRNLEFKKYLELEIPLPPIKIQKRIVVRIEELFEKIDRAKESRQKVQEETAEIFPVALEEIFAKAKKKCEMRSLKNVIKLNQSGVWGDNPQNNQKSYPVIRSTEMTHEGQLDLTSVSYRYIPKDKIDKYSLKDGDLLIVKSSGSRNLIGRCVLFNQPNDKKIYLFSNFIQRFRPNNLIVPEYLHYFLNFEGRKFVQLLQTTTTGLRNLPVKQYIELAIPLPPLSGQKRIVAYLDNLREKVEKLRQLQQNQLEELIELKQSILSKAFKGELVK